MVTLIFQKTMEKNRTTTKIILESFNKTMNCVVDCVFIAKLNNNPYSSPRLPPGMASVLGFSLAAVFMGVVLIATLYRKNEGQK